MSDPKEKRGCRVCGWRGYRKHVLSDKNPFDSGDTVYGCPECFEVNSIEVVCDEPICKEFVSCGTPTKEGYRNTCSTHRPRGE